VIVAVQWIAVTASEQSEKDRDNGSKDGHRQGILGHISKVLSELPGDL
jgi:hypothetical protein